jgi:hypothetical protein
MFLLVEFEIFAAQVWAGSKRKNGIPAVMLLGSALQVELSFPQGRE